MTTGNRTQTKRITISVANRYNMATPKCLRAEGLGIEPRMTESKSAVIPFNYPPVFGGNEWTRTTSILRMKEVDYHCPTLPYRNTFNISSMLTQRTFRPCQRTVHWPHTIGGYCSSKMFLYGRGTGNRTLIYWLKASYFSR